MFSTPENEPVAVVVADIPLIATAGSATADEPLADVEQAVARSRADADADARADADAHADARADAWSSFATVGEVLAAHLVDDRCPQVVLQWVKRVDAGQAGLLFAAAPRTITARIDAPGRPGGLLAFIALADAPPDVVAQVLEVLAVDAPSEGGWRPYSFVVHAGVNRDVRRALHALTVQLVKSMAAACSAALSSPIRQRVAQFHHAGWDDYAAGVTLPSLFISFRLDPLEGRFLLSWPLDMAMSLIDLLLGGAGDPLPAERRPSPLDLELLEILFSRALSEIPSAFEPLAAVSVTDARVHLDPALVQGSLSGGTYLVAWMSTEVAGVEHASTFAIPTLAVQPFTDAILGRDEWSLVGDPHPAVRQRLLDVPVEVSVGLRPLSLPATDLAGLRAGDVIALDTALEQSFYLASGPVEFAAVTPASRGGRLLVQVTSETSEGPGALARAAGALSTTAPVT